MSALAAPTFQLIPLAELRESPLNPRKHYDAAALEDLTASIRAKGVITPLLVRPCPDALLDEDAKGRVRVRPDLNGHPGYEIAAGHRRLRAARAAGLAELPALVRPMDDTEFLEVLIFENDEREDLHPLEEAEGYKTLMTKAGYTVERLAERRGCSVKYIYDRVKLLALIPKAQALFRQNAFTAGHAILLARLKAADQERVIGTGKDDHRGDPLGGLFRYERLLWDPEDDGAAEESRKPVSVRELEAYIAEHVKFDPAGADPMLFPETVGALTTAQEVAEKVIQITYDSYVQAEARDPKERIYGPRSWKRADGTRGNKRCELAITGVVVVGPHRGEAFKVCTDKDRCATHWAAEQREKKKRAVVTAKGAPQDRWKREEEKRKAEQAREEAEKARWTKATPAILEALAAAVKKASARANGLLGSIVLEACAPRDWGRPKHPAGDYIPRGQTAEDLVRHAAFVVLAGELTEYDAAREFPKRAKAFGLDVRKIVDQAAPAAKASLQTTASGATNKKAGKP